MTWMTTCEETAEMLSASLDGQLPTTKRIALTFHLMMCHKCSRYKEQLHIIHKVLRNWHHPQEHDRNIHLSKESKQRIQQTIKNID